MLPPATRRWSPASATNLNTQGTRPGITYAAWAAGNPLLTDPNGDGDADGVSNYLEYGAGTDGLNPADRPVPVVSFEDLTGLGFSNREIVYRYPVAANADDFTLLPTTSTNLQTWGFAPLQFLNATNLGGYDLQLRFRAAGPQAPRRFFRADPSEE